MAIEHASEVKETKDIKLGSKPKPKKAISRELFLTLIANGIPIGKAVFHKVVSSWNGEPEYAFYAVGAKPSRTARMWMTPMGLVWEHNEAVMGLIPLGNVSETRFL